VTWVIDYVVIAIIIANFLSMIHTKGYYNRYLFSSNLFQTQTLKPKQGKERGMLNKIK
jgi:hypothetical protein